MDGGAAPVPVLVVGDCLVGVLAEVLPARSAALRQLGHSLIPQWVHIQSRLPFFWCWSHCWHFSPSLRPTEMFVRLCAHCSGGGDDAAAAGVVEPLLLLPPDWCADGAG